MEELKREMDAQKALREEMAREQQDLAERQRKATEADQQGRQELAKLEVELRKKKDELMEKEAKARRQQRELEEERHRINMEKSQQEGRTPLYWVNHSAKGRWHHQEDLDPLGVEFVAIQRLVDQTFNASAVGRGWVGYTMSPAARTPPASPGHASTAPAAATAGTAAASAPAEKHTRLEVTKVTRVEDAKMWREYMQALEDIEAATEKDVEPPETVAILHDEKMLADWTIGSTLDQSKNEALLWHGTTHGQDDTNDIAAIIQKCGFDERVTNPGGLYGAAVYFAESSSKADAYAGKVDGKSNGIGSQGTLFLTRVALGTPHRTDVPLKQIRRPPTVTGLVDKPGAPIATTDRRCDSVVASKKSGFAGSPYREFMIYDRRQAYGEFMVQYVRRGPAEQ